MRLAAREFSLLGSRARRSCPLPAIRLKTPRAAILPERHQPTMRGCAMKGH